MRFRYRQYTIYREPPPIPTRAHDWAYVHDDYDGPEDGRCGTGASLLDCLQQIEEESE